MALPKVRFTKDALILPEWDEVARPSSGMCSLVEIAGTSSLSPELLLYCFKQGYMDGQPRKGLDFGKTHSFTAADIRDKLSWRNCSMRQKYGWPNVSKTLAATFTGTSSSNRLKVYIEDHSLGTVLETEVGRNRATNALNYVFLWTLDWNALYAHEIKLENTAEYRTWVAHKEAGWLESF